MKTKIILFCLLLFICLIPIIQAQDYFEEEVPEEESEYLVTEYDEYTEDESEYSGKIPNLVVYDFDCGDGFSWVDANDATAYLRVSILEYGSLQIPSYESLEAILEKWSLNVDHCRYMYEYAVDASRSIGADFFVMGRLDQIKKRYIVSGTVYSVSTGEELFGLEISSDKKAELNPTLDEFAGKLVKDLPEYYYLLEDESEDDDSAEDYEYTWDLSEEEESTEIDYSIYETEDMEKIIRDDNFCNDITQILDDSNNNFSNLKGAEISVEGDLIKTYKHETSVSLQIADKCYVQLLLGNWSYWAMFGTFPLLTTAKEKCDEIMDRLNSCLGNSIYFNKLVKDDGMISYEIGKQGADYFSSKIMYINMYQDSNNEYVAYFSANKPTTNKIFRVPYSYGSNDEIFNTNLKKQMSNAYNTFEDIRGEKHVEESIWETKIHYDINAKLPGSNSCIFNETGGFLFKACKSEFYAGDSRATAVEVYDELAQKIKDVLGSDYVYKIKEIYEDNPKGNMIFAKESELDVKTPVVTLKANEISGNYYVNIEVLFNKFTGIGL